MNATRGRSKSVFRESVRVSFRCDSSTLDRFNDLAQRRQLLPGQLLAEAVATLEEGHDRG
jgi:hypothetical protein